MGGNQSSSVENIQFRQIPTSSTPSQLPSGVHIVNNLDAKSHADVIYKKIEEAYEKGKQDGLQSLQFSIEKVAAQVYENMQAQLISIEQEKIKAAEEKGKAIHEKLNQGGLMKREQYQSLCKTQEQALSACLKENSKQPLACESLVTSYINCSVATNSAN